MMRMSRHVIHPGPSGVFGKLGVIPDYAENMCFYSCRIQGGTEWCEVSYYELRGRVPCRFLRIE